MKILLGRVNIAFGHAVPPSGLSADKERAISPFIPSMDYERAGVTLTTRTTGKEKMLGIRWPEIGDAIR